LIPVIQSRVGENGTCFRASIASLLELPESKIPDWPKANEDSGVNPWLVERGLRYSEVPASDPPPVGYHLALGKSPRGGEHAVVMEDGELVHDPHPEDGTGQGLVDADRWGVLTMVGRVKAEDEDKFDRQAAEYVKRHNTASKEYKVAFKAIGARMWPMDDAHELKPYNQKCIAENMRETGYRPRLPYPLTVLNSFPNVTQKQRKQLTADVDRIYQKYGGTFGKDSVSLHPDKDGEMQLRYTARDALRGEELSAAAGRLKARHDDLWHQPTRAVVGGQTAYAAMARPVEDLLREAEALLKSTRISDKAAWQAKLVAGRELLATAKADAAKRDYESAAYRADAALSAAHYVIDALRALARRTGAKDNKPPYRPGDRIRLPNGRKTTVTKVLPAKNLLGEREWHVSTRTGEVLPMKVKDSDLDLPEDFQPERHSAEIVRANKAKRPFSIRRQGERQPSLFGQTFHQENLLKETKDQMHRAFDRALDAYGWSPDTPLKVIQAAQKRAKKQSAAALRRDREREARQALKEGTGGRVALSEARRILGERG